MEIHQNNYGPIVIVVIFSSSSSGFSSFLLIEHYHIIVAVIVIICKWKMLSSTTYMVEVNINHVNVYSRLDIGITSYCD